MKTIRTKLTYANVVSTLALIVAIGGGTTAIAISGKVGAKDLAKTKVREVGSPSNVQAVDVKANCGKGERLIGGGGSMAQGSLKSSEPEGRGWRIQGGGTATPSNSGRAVAFCLSK